MDLLNRASAAYSPFIASAGLLFLYVVPVIVGLTLLAKDELKSIFIGQGRLKQGLTFGLVPFASFAAIALVMQSNSSDFFSSLPAQVPWLLLFIFANAIMEEL